MAFWEFLTTVVSVLAALAVFAVMMIWFVPVVLALGAAVIRKLRGELL